MRRERDERRPKPRFSGPVQTCKFCTFKFDETKSKCPSCGKFNSPGMVLTKGDETILLSDVSPAPIEKVASGPWDTCFSEGKGGVVLTSVTLLGGGPGAGKSTLSLKLAEAVAIATGREALYIAKEQSEDELKQYAIRVGVLRHDLIRLFPMGAGGDIGPILLARKPGVVIVDSLSKLTPDHDKQVEVCKFFKEYAVQLKMPIVILSHVTKDGDFQGLMSLQHEVDILMTIFPIQGVHKDMREMVVHKSRFGPSFEPLHLLMTEHGLVKYERQEEEDEDDA